MLRRELKRRGFGLLVIYGRRRVGKTALVLKATEDMRRLYYLAVERGNLPGSRGRRGTPRCVTWRRTGRRYSPFWPRE